MSTIKLLLFFTGAVAVGLLHKPWNMVCGGLAIAAFSLIYVAFTRRFWVAWMGLAAVGLIVAYSAWPNQSAAPPPKQQSLPPEFDAESDPCTPERQAARAEKRAKDEEQIREFLKKNGQAPKDAPILKEEPDDPCATPAKQPR